MKDLSILADLSISNFFNSFPYLSSMSRRSTSIPHVKVGFLALKWKVKGRQLCSLFCNTLEPDTFIKKYLVEDLFYLFAFLVWETTIRFNFAVTLWNKWCIKWRFFLLQKFVTFVCCHFATNFMIGAHF